MSVKLKTIVHNQLPEFVREDYPVFSEFVQAYYDYLDQYEKRNLTDIRDIDTTVDSFIQYFKSELNVFGESAYDNINNVLLLRKIKQIYTAKGSEPAYKFMFKVLFGKSIDISYPWDQVLKASDGKWQQENSIFLRVLSGDVNSIVGNNIFVINSTTRIKVYVQKIVFVRDNVYEVFIDKNYYGTINTSDTVKFKTFSAEILPTTVGYTVENAGEGFKVGDLVEADTIAGSETIKSLLKVTKVNSNGGIVKLSTVKFGAGYSDEFFVLLNKVAFTNLSSISITKDSAIQYGIPDNTYLEEYNEFGFIVNPNYVQVEYGDTTYVGALLREFFTKTANNESVTDYSLIRFKVGAVAKYQGYYTTNDGFLDDIIKIQDSYYYQKYSYLITVDARLEDYSTILKSYLHTAGIKLFGEYQIQNNYVLNISAQAFVDEYVSKATFRTINKSITNQYVSMGDAGGRIKLNPYDGENYFEVDYNPETFNDFTG